MKRTIFAASGILAMILVLAVAGCRGGFGLGCAGDPGKMIDKEVKDLNLTPAQKAKLDTIKKEIAADMKAHQEQMKSIRADVDKELAKPNPDVNTLSANVKKQLTAWQNPGVKMVDYFTQFYNTLDAKQQKQLLEKIKAWEKNCPGMYGDGKKGCFGKGSCRDAKKGCPMAGK